MHTGLSFLGALLTITGAAMMWFLTSLILKLLTAWKVFEKYGEPGWKGLIPFYCDYIEYGKVWDLNIGIIYIACCLVAGGTLSVAHEPGWLASAAQTAAFVIGCIFAYRKSRSFGYSIGMTLLLIFFPFIGNIIIGFGDARYLGRQD